MRYNFILTRMTIINKIDKTTRVDKDVEKLELSYTAGENVNDVALLWKKATSLTVHEILNVYQRTNTSAPKYITKTFKQM